MMASQDPNDGFRDIHADPNDLMTEYLPEDIKTNWCHEWSHPSFLVENNFLETCAYIKAKKQLWNAGWVTVCGNTGDGKTSLAEHLACNFARGPWQLPIRNRKAQNVYKDKEDRRRFVEENINESMTRHGNYRPIFVKSAEEFNQKADVHAEQHQIMIVDDIFGKAAFDWSLMEEWRPILESLVWNIIQKQTRILVVVCVNKAHLAQAPDDIQHMEWFRPGVMIDLTDSHALKCSERDRMMKIYGASQKEIEDFSRNKRGYMPATPLTCRMFLQGRSLASSKGMAFFDNPFEPTQASIDKIWDVDKILYYTLSVAAMLNGRLDLSKTINQLDPSSANIFHRLIPLLSVPEQVDLTEIRYAATLLVGFFFKPVRKWQFEFSHPKIYHLCVKSLYQRDKRAVLQLFTWRFVLDHVRIVEKHGQREDEMVIACDFTEWDVLCERFTQYIRAGYMKQVLQNESCRNTQFVKVWFAKMHAKGELEEAIRMVDPELHRSLLYWACYYGNGQIVVSIFEYGSQYVLQEERFKRDMQYALQAACCVNSSVVYLAVNALITNGGVNVNATERNNDYNYKQICMQIFGRELSVLMTMGAPPIHIAARMGHNATVECLIQHGASVSETTADKITPLHRAAGRRDKDAKQVIKVLVRHGANIRAKTERNTLPLHEAFHGGCLETVEALVDAGADLTGVEGQMEDNTSFMVKAIQSQQADLVEYLLKKGVSARGNPDDDVFSPLDMAVHQRDVAILERLLGQHGMDPNFCSGSKLTPLHVACLLGEYEMAEILLRRGADVNMAKNDREVTPLHLAAEKGIFHICDLLLEHGAQTEALTRNGETPLVLAARNNNKGVCWLLLDEGMSLKDTDRPVPGLGPVNETEL